MKKSHIDCSKTYRSLLQNEIEILGQCRHPQILQMHDMLEDNENYYVVSEYLKGATVM